MVGQVYEWDDYFIPGTTVLRNLAGITDQDALTDFEYKMSSGRSVQLATGAVEIPATFDAAHLKALHFQLARDVYEWAGEFRTVGIMKRTLPDMWADPDVPEFGHFLPHQSLDHGMNFLTDMIRATDWRQLDVDQVAAKLTDVHTYVNYAHPFREQNGRVTRLFVESLANHAGFSVDGDFPGHDTYVRAVIEADQGNSAALEKIWRDRLRPIGDRLEQAKPLTLAERVAQLQRAPMPTPKALAPAGYYGPTVN